MGLNGCWRALENVIATQNSITFIIELLRYSKELFIEELFSS